MKTIIYILLILTVGCAVHTNVPMAESAIYIELEELDGVMSLDTKTHYYEYLKKELKGNHNINLIGKVNLFTKKFEHEDHRRVDIEVTPGEFINSIDVSITFYNNYHYSHKTVTLEFINIQTDEEFEHLYKSTYNLISQNLNLIPNNYKLFRLSKTLDRIDDNDGINQQEATIIAKLSRTIGGVVEYQSFEQGYHTFDVYTGSTAYLEKYKIYIHGKTGAIKYGKTTKFKHYKDLFELRKNEIIKEKP